MENNRVTQLYEDVCAAELNEINIMACDQTLLVVNECSLLAQSGNANDNSTTDDGSKDSKSEDSISDEQFRLDDLNARPLGMNLEANLVTRLVDTVVNRLRCDVAMAMAESGLVPEESDCDANSFRCLSVTNDVNSIFSDLRKSTAIALGLFVQLHKVLSTSKNGYERTSATNSRKSSRKHHHLMDAQRQLCSALATAKQYDALLFAECVLKCNGAVDNKSWTDLIVIESNEPRNICNETEFRLINLQSGYELEVDRLCTDIRKWSIEQYDGQSLNELTISDELLHALSRAARACGKTRMLVQTLLHVLPLIVETKSSRIISRRPEFFAVLQTTFELLDFADQVDILDACFSSTNRIPNLTLFHLTAHKKGYGLDEEQFLSKLTGVVNKLTDSAQTSPAQELDTAKSLTWSILMSPRCTIYKLLKLCLNAPTVASTVVRTLRLVPPVLTLCDHQSHVHTIHSCVGRLFEHELQDTTAYDDAKADRFAQMLITLSKRKTCAAGEVNDTIEVAVLDANVLINHHVCDWINRAANKEYIGAVGEHLCEVLLQLTSRLLCESSTNIRWNVNDKLATSQSTNESMLNDEIHVGTYLLMFCTWANHYKQRTIVTNEPADYDLLAHCIRMHDLCVTTIKTICNRVANRKLRLCRTTIDWLCNNVQVYPWTLKFLVLTCLKPIWPCDRSAQKPEVPSCVFSMLQTGWSSTHGRAGVQTGKSMSTSAVHTQSSTTPSTFCPFCHSHIVDNTRILIGDNRQAKYLKVPCENHQSENCVLVSLLELAVVDDKMATELFKDLNLDAHKDRDRVWSQLVLVLSQFVSVYPAIVWFRLANFLHVLVSEVDVPKRSQELLCPIEASRIAASAIEKCKPLLLLGDAVMRTMFNAQKLSGLPGAQSPTTTNATVWSDQPLVQHIIRAYCDVAKQTAVECMRGIADVGAIRKQGASINSQTSMLSFISAQTSVDQPVFASTTLTQIFTQACVLASQLLLCTDVGVGAHEVGIKQGPEPKVASVLQHLLVTLSQYQSQSAQHMMSRTNKIRPPAPTTTAGLQPVAVNNIRLPDTPPDQMPLLNQALSAPISPLTKPTAVSRKEHLPSASSFYRRILYDDDESTPVADVNTEINVTGFGTTVVGAQTDVGYKQEKQQQLQAQRQWHTSQQQYNVNEQQQQYTEYRQGRSRYSHTQYNQSNNHNYYNNSNRVQRGYRSGYQTVRRSYHSSNSSSDGGHRKSRSPVSTSWMNTSSRQIELNDRQLENWERDRALWTGASERTSDTRQSQHSIGASTHVSNTSSNDIDHNMSAPNCTRSYASALNSKTVSATQNQPPACGGSQQRAAKVYNRAVKQQQQQQQPRPLQYRAK